MKKIILLLLSAIPFFLFGQEENQNAKLSFKDSVFYINTGGCKSGACPLVLLNNTPLKESNDIVKIDPSDVEAYQIIRDKKELAVYGEKAKKGLLKITVKDIEKYKQYLGSEVKRVPGKITFTRHLKNSDIEEYFVREPRIFQDSILVTLNGMPLTGSNSFLISLKSEDIKEFKVFKIVRGTEAIEKYGDAAKNGVIEIEVNDIDKFIHHLTKEQQQQLRAKAEEEIEYETLVFAPGYDAFVATQPSKSFFTEASLKAKNTLMVSEWNARHRNSQRYSPSIYEENINYDSSIDYGIDVEYSIYMFLRFMEKEHNMSLIGDKQVAQR